MNAYQEKTQLGSSVFASGPGIRLIVDGDRVDEALAHEAQLLAPRRPADRLQPLVVDVADLSQAAAVEVAYPETKSFMGPAAEFGQQAIKPRES